MKTSHPHVIVHPLLLSQKKERRKKKEKRKVGKGRGVVWEEGIKTKKVEKERRGKGGKERRKKGEGKRKKNERNIAPTRLETITIVVFLDIILVNTCYFICTVITSWQVEIAVSCPFYCPSCQALI